MLKKIKGAKDFLPDEMIVRQFVIDKIKEIFERFGFDPLETPALESWNVLSAKGAGGSEILKETYNFKDRAGRRIGLRYDLTVPLARVVSSIPNLTLPFKRYQISRVWRYGDVSKGRLREFWQADIDVVGSNSMCSDAEIIACAGTIFKTLGFKDFFVRLNNRKVLNAMVEIVGIEKKPINIFRIIDKLDKIGIDGVKTEMKRIGLKKNEINELLSMMKLRGSPIILKKIKDIIKTPLGKEGILELEKIIYYLKDMGFTNIKIDLSLARGLDYYTGPIFEFWVDENIGSVAGGGRYDEMIERFSDRGLPATGISIGIERVLEVMKKRGMVKMYKTKAKVFVANVKEEFFREAVKLAKRLRSEGINTLVDLMGRNLRKQMEYVNAKQIPFTIFVGEKEVREKKFTLRNMVSGSESLLEIKDIIKRLKETKLFNNFV